MKINLGDNFIIQEVIVKRNKHVLQLIFKNK